MKNYVYSYEEWLSSHANHKTMMQKLERSLVPYELFQAINLKNDRKEHKGEITIGLNTYSYDIKYDYNCIGHDVYDADLKVVALEDKWHNLLMGYNKFKVVMDHQIIKTIYSDHEDFFQQIIDMFERDDYAALYARRSSYINNVLARYILLRLLDVHRPELQLITSIDTPEDGKVNVLAADANRNEWIMYAFSKREARALAQRLDGCCNNLTVIYFFNQDFEKEGNTLEFSTGCTRIMSARSFMMGLPMDTMEKRLIEKRMLMLISMLYNEHLEWHFDRIKHIAMNPPDGILARKKQRIPRTLLEDALNVLSDVPVTHTDIFHFFCAANLVNAYINHYNRSEGMFSTKQVNRMFQAKQQIFNCIKRLAEEHNRNVRIGVCAPSSLFVNLKVEKKNYQISFRGAPRDIIDQVIKSGYSHEDHFEGHYLQPIATALYQYSYMLRWAKKKL